MLVDALRSKGLLGTDESDLLDALFDLGVEMGEEYAEDHNWSEELRSARADGFVDDLGCGWVRLSRIWWTATITAMVDRDPGKIVDMLAGDGELEPVGRVSP